MSAKKRDNKNRWRNVTVAFRMSPEESEQLNTFVKLSGLTKQEYIIRRLLVKEVVIQGNTRVYKALREQFSEVKGQLERIEAGGPVDQELLDTIRLMNTIIAGMGEVSYV
ncbi:plasmid mobilization protein [Flavonifractor sp. An4]|uniref:plasmid mobilization protein n=1 Tax=Flavonifractor sp. An4 TaxID=1965634 RepID=UPI000B396E6D|nr:hypothetical protein [Flavonifractor sp. An4]OUO16899.1 hypothetical protein B5F94_05260 [Flavonifractor sp. An4]